MYKVKSDMHIPHEQALTHSLPYQADTPVAEHMPETPALRGYPYALGRCAVDDALDYASVVTDTQVMYPDLLDWRLEYIANYSEQARAKIADLDDENRAEAAELLDLGNMSEALRTMVGDGQDITDNGLLLDRLVLKRGEDYAVPEATLINVMEWHNDRLSERQKSYNAEELPRHKAEYMERLERSVTAGWLPPGVVDTMEDRFARTKVWLDDGFETALKGQNGFMVYFDDTGYWVTLSPTTAGRTVHHEFTHIMEGRDEPADGVKEEDVETGMFRLFDEDAPIALVLNEAVAEHINSSLEYGNPEVTDAFDDSRDTASYFSNRFLLHALANALCGDGQRVGAQAFIAMFVENGRDRDRLGEQSAEAVLRRRLGDAFPDRDIVAELNAMHSTEDKSMAKTTQEYALDILEYGYPFGRAKALNTALDKTPTPEVK